MSSKRDLSKLNIIVIDDNKNMRSLICEILHGFRMKHVEEAEDVPAALQVLKYFPADLLITDWNMKPLDGIEFVRMIRTAKDSRAPNIPIIMLTGFAEIRRVVEARDAGVNEFLAKPISAKSLYSRIVSVIENDRPFVRCTSYVGPDRRRQDLGPPNGIGERRGAVIETARESLKA